MLTSTTAALLKVLDRQAGFTTGRIAELSGIKFGHNKRTLSGAIRQWLIELKAQGFVDYLDDLKPVCWKATAAGEAALKDWLEKHER